MFSYDDKYFLKLKKICVVGSVGFLKSCTIVIGPRVTKNPAEKSCCSRPAFSKICFKARSHERVSRATSLSNTNCELCWKYYKNGAGKFPVILKIIVPRYSGVKVVSQFTSNYFRICTEFAFQVHQFLLLFRVVTSQLGIISGSPEQYLQKSSLK